MPHTPDLPALVGRVRALRGAGARVVVGIVGEPGSGKSTLAGALVAALLAAGERAALVPMDGFHLANVELARQGKADRKGAPDTFDAGGYAALLARLKAARNEVIYAPTYDRTVEESIANAIAVPPEVSVIVTEGNYLLLDGAWAAVAPILDEVWAVRVDDAERRDRLVARHVAFGKEPDHALAWVRTVDEPNARLVRDSLGRAGLQVWECDDPESGPS